MLPPPKPTTPTERSFVLPAGCTEVLHLMGATRLADFLTFAKERTDLAAYSSGGRDGMMELAESWRDAATVYDALSVSEPYPGEAPVVFPIPDAMREHCDRLLSQAHIQREFDIVPVTLGMIPVAQLVCAQQRLDVRPSPPDVRQRPSDAALFATCLPLTTPPHKFQVLQQSIRHKQGSVTFSADNHDIRLLQTQIMEGQAIAGEWPGHAQHVLAFPVGFSSNVVNAIRFQNRLVLNNGYHRVFDLHRLGVTHVPAIIHVCRQWEDVGMVGSTEVFENGSIYFERERPPLIKDFADQRLTLSLAVRSSRKYVRIKFEVETGYFDT